MDIASSDSSPVRAGKFKKQLRAPCEYVWESDWKVVHRYPTGCRAQLDVEDIDFDIYKRACELMELSSMKLLPEQEVQAGDMHRWQLIRQASTASIGYAVREFGCPMRHMFKCKVGLRIVEGPGFLQLELCGSHDRQSHVTPQAQRRSLLGSIEDNNCPPELIGLDDEDEAYAKKEDDNDDDDDDDDDDADDSWDDNAHDAVEGAQQSLDEGMYQNILLFLIAT